MTIVVPVMLGDGVRLFEQVGGFRVRLERFSLSYVERATNVWYRVVR
ncbi:hypothetical protein [Kibdelosporangium phytohabitans]|nr:hypothetical protein [Kibdelosporangium phytohabitans]